MRDEERVAVLEGGDLRVEELLERLPPKVLVVRQVAVPQVEEVAEERRQRAGEEDGVRVDAVGQRGGAVLHVVQQRKLPEAQRAADEHGERHERRVGQVCAATAPESCSVGRRQRWQRPLLAPDQILDLRVRGEDRLPPSHVPLRRRGVRERRGGGGGEHRGGRRRDEKRRDISTTAALSTHRCICDAVVAAAAARRVV